MPPKGKGKKKGGGRKKKVALYTSEEHMGLFGLKEANQLLKTPLGCMVTVLGVKYTTSVDDKSSAKLIVRYPNGSEVPLEARGAAELMNHGFRLASESVHIERDITSYKLEQRIYEEKRASYDLQIKLRLEALALESKGRGAKKQQKIGGAPRPQTR